MGGAIRVKAAEYFLGSFIHLRGDNVLLFGDGYTRVIHLQTPSTLKTHH